MKVQLAIKNFPAQQQIFDCTTPYVIVPKGRRFGITVGAANYFIKSALGRKFTKGLWGDVVNSNIEKYIERLFVPHLQKLPPHLWKWTKDPHVLHIGQAYIDFRSAERPECHDDSTEVLTDSGWMLFSDLEGSEKVLTLNPSSLIAEWELPYRYTNQPYDGPMISIKSKKLDMLVTPNHRFLFKSHTKSIITTIDKANKHWAIPASVGFIGVDNKKYTDDMCAIIGFYLAEGSSQMNKGGYRVTFAQTEGIKGGCKGDIRADFLAILKRAGFNPCLEKDRIRVTNKQLYSLLKPLGYAGTKYIPNEIKNLPPHKLKIVIDWMLKGDGSIRVRKDKKVIELVYYSVSKRLVDDFQELLVKTGRSGTVSIKNNSNYYRKLNDGREIKATQTCYQVQVCNNELNYLGYGGKSYLEDCYYTGRVFCVSTKNGYILTRRNGKIAWSGNSWEGFGYELAFLNEAGIILKNPYLWDNAIKPMFWDNNCHVIVGGTPKGKGEFFKLYQRGMDPEQKQYTSFRFSSFDNPYVNHQRILEDMKDMPENVAKQEIYAEFLDDTGVVFRGVLKVAILKPEGPKPGHLYVCGVDVAKVQDFTVIAVYDRENNHQMFQMRFNQLEWPVVKQRIKEVSAKYNNALVVLDATGPGSPVFDDLIRDRVPVEGYKFTNESKKVIIEKLANWIELSHIKMLQLTETLDEFNNFTYDISASGRVMYEAPVGFHDDIVMAHALAVYSLQPIPLAIKQKDMSIIAKDIYEKTQQKGQTEEDSNLSSGDEYEEYEY